MASFTSPFTGKIFTSIRSTINHLRYIEKTTGTPYYDLSKQFYDFNNHDSTVCELCGQEKTFRTLSIGYFCENKICVDKRSLSARLSFRGKHKEDYVEYIKNNIEFYRDNIDNKNVIDPFFNKSTLKQNLRTFVSKNIGANNKEIREIFQYKKYCAGCDSYYNDDPFKPIRKNCGKPKCSSFIKNFGETNLINSRNFISKCLDILNNPDADILLKFNKIKKELINVDVHTTKFLVKEFYKETKITLKDKINISVCLNHLIIDPEKIQYVIVNNNIFLSYPNATKEHFIKFFKENKDDLEKTSYFSNCVICSNHMQQTEFFTNNHISRFCSNNCYRISLTRKEEFHPTLIPTEESRKKSSERMKSLILTGKFTPNVTNSWCRSKICVTINGVDIDVRSSWEAVFYLANPHLKYELIRIPYKRPNGKVSNYITDFVDDVKKIVYEIKPNSEKDTEIYAFKVTAAKQWCLDNGYSYVIISDEWFFDYFLTDSYVDDWKDQPSYELIIKRMKQFMKKEK